jgi:hypothetical protein
LCKINEGSITDRARVLDKCDNVVGELAGIIDNPRISDKSDADRGE